MLGLPLRLNPKPFAPISLHPNPKNSPFFSRSRLNPKPPLLASSSSSPPPSSSPNPNRDFNPSKPRSRRSKPKKSTGEASDATYPSTIPRKPRRGRRSEAAAVEDFVRGRLEATFAAIREQNAAALDGKGEILKPRVEAEEEDLLDSKRGEQEEEEKVVVEEEDPDWPLDADIGWGIRASEYFDKHPIKNVVVDGVEIDWEGEMEEGWVKEINCLEWESFAFHPSPLVVLVFERYKRAADNWMLLKELEKAAKVYWSAKDRLPPRTVKIDINIETDLAYALKVKEGPQLLFLKGNKILYREKEMRSADELVQMIAHFYYNAKRPSWVDAAAIAPPF